MKKSMDEEKNVIEEIRNEPVVIIKIAKALDLAGYVVHSLEPAIVTGDVENLLALEIYPKKGKKKTIPALPV